MATINFLYRSTKPESTLTLRLLFNQKQIEARTRHHVSKIYWDQFHEAKYIKDAEMKALQTLTRAELPKLETHVLKSFYVAPEAAIDKYWLNTIIQEYYQPRLDSNDIQDALIPSLEAYIEVKRNDLAKSTKKKYNVVKQMLLRFQSQSGKKLRIRDINLSFKQNFEKYCFDQNYAPNTIAKAFKIVKTVCNHAKRRGVQVSPELDEVKLRSVETDTVFLTLEDIEKIEKLSGIPEYLDNARDWLLISCHTGQRISDFMKFDRSMIVKTNNSKGDVVQVIQFRQTKTKSPVSIPLNMKVLELLAKREGSFPRKISDQKYNLFIKDVCKRAGLTYKVHGSKKDLISSTPKKRWRKKTGIFEKWELVSSHIGRRSFATNNYGNMPTSALAYATGHKSETMFLKYMGKNSMDMALVLSDYF